MSKPYRKLVHVNAAFAAEHPGHPTHQRVSSEQHIGRLLEIIQAGDFIAGDLCPSPIHLDADGYVIDGLHRVKAIARAEQSILMPVIFNSTPELVEKDHAVRARSVVDRAQLISCHYYDKFAHTVTQYAFSSSRSLRGLDVYDWLGRFDAIAGKRREVYQAFLDIAKRKTAGRIGMKAAGVASVMGVCLRAIANDPSVREQVETFFDDFLSNAGSGNAKALFILRMEEEIGLNGSDTVRHAFNLTAQLALSNVLAGKVKRGTKFSLPLEKTVGPKGQITLKVRGEDLIAVPSYKPRIA